MAKVLIVEDSLLQASMLATLLTKAGYETEIAANGRIALESLARQAPDAVLTDLIMPEVDGLELVERIRQCYPRVAAVLMTGQGNEEIAAEALQRGACSYIPKRRIEQDLLSTISNILGLRSADRRHQKLVACWTDCEQQFELDNSPALISQLVAHFQDQLTLLQFGDESLRMRISVALSETLDNAIFHGNLEMSSDLRKQPGNVWSETARTRQQQSPYKDRRVYVQSKLSRAACEFTIRDQGRGFDPSKLPDPTNRANLENLSGRGVFLVRTFMDEVRFNDRGNQVTLIKRRPTPCER